MRVCRASRNRLKLDNESGYIFVEPTFGEIYIARYACASDRVDVAPNRLCSAAQNLE